MKRPFGIIFCSIVLSLAASVTLFLATLTVSSTFTVRKLLPAAAMSHSVLYNILVVGIYLGLAAFLILTVIGILRLRAWARYLVLVMGGVVAAVGLFSIFTLAISHSQIPQSNLDPHEQQFIWILGLVNGLVAGIGI